MIVVPDTEKQRFELLLNAAAEKYGLPVRDYLRKVWYHEEAAKLGEYVALLLTEELVTTLGVSERISREVQPSDDFLNDGSQA